MLKLLKRSFKDVRVLQVFFLGALLSYGFIAFDFSLSLYQSALVFISGFFTQIFWIKLLKLKWTSLFSAFITCLSLALLLRADNIWIHPLSAFLSINSKFLVQYKRKHFFNPSGFGIFCVLFLESAWLSPGQWGSPVSLAMWLGAGAFFIVKKAKSLDVAFLFAFFYLLGLFLRNTYFSYEIEIFYHSALKGSLLLFTFFMISDPKTTPLFLKGKILFTFVVAIIALVLQYFFYLLEPALIYALMVGSLLLPFLNKPFVFFTKKI